MCYLHLALSLAATAVTAFSQSKVQSKPATANLQQRHGSPAFAGAFDFDWDIHLEVDSPKTAPKKVFTSYLVTLMSYRFPHTYSKEAAQTPRKIDRPAAG
jgi:hypothetical protein